MLVAPGFREEERRLHLPSAVDVLLVEKLDALFAPFRPEHVARSLVSVATKLKEQLVIKKFGGPNHRRPLKVAVDFVFAPAARTLLCRVPLITAWLLADVHAAPLAKP